MSLSQIPAKEDQSIQEEKFLTRRATVPALEEILFKALPVLDHGFVRVIDYMGDDSAIVQAARVSYGKGTKHVQQDQGLINYLMRHWHTTPFEMCEIKFHVKLPIFVARHWIRHRTANVNEYSARYSVLDKEYYLPASEHLAVQSEANRQGRGEVLNAEESQRVLEILKEDAERVYDHYQEMLNINEQGEILDANRSGLTRELARLNLTLNYYTQWYWKTDLHNLFHFLQLRADSHAQFEIRAYGEVIMDIAQRWVPFAFQAFLEYRHHSVQLSRTAVQAIQRLIKGEKLTLAESGLSAREGRELEAALGMSFLS